MTKMLSIRKINFVGLIFLLHIWQVLEKLQSIFAGFENNGSEPLYILMGSFVSKPLGRAVGGREVVQGAFDTLADIIAKFPNQAQNAKFLFVPGT